jgi:FkbM family methyltransferase
MLLRAVARQFLPRRLKPHRILRGPLAGRRIVTSWHDYPAAILGYAERALVEWLLENVRPGETWLDVGAHYGYTAIAMCERVGKQGRVFAFEPVLSTVGCLDLTKRINNYNQLQILPFALSSSERLNVAKYVLVRGMMESRMSTNRNSEQDEVLSLAFDRLWDDVRGQVDFVHGIKIDVQGMEVETLAGMKQCLTRYQPTLILEVHPGVPRSQILEILSECGYDTVPHPIEQKVQTDFFDESSNYSFLFRSSKLPR